MVRGAWHGLWGGVATVIACGASAHATIVETQTFSGTSTIIDTPYIGNAGATNKKVVVFAMPDLAPFDTTRGVLTGVAVKLNSSLSQSTTLSGTASGSGQKRNRADNGSTPFVMLAGVNGGAPVNLVSVSQSQSCGTAAACPASVGPVHSTATAAFVIPRASWSAGSDPVTAVLGSTLTALNTTTGSWKSTQDKYTVEWSGTVEVDYAFQQHAAAAFAGGADNLVLDFGTLAAGSHATSRGFDILNLAPSDLEADGRLAMSFDAAGSAAGGDTADFAFGSAFATISNLAAGGDVAFTAWFDPRQVGRHSATYRIAFSDGQGGSTALDLTMKADVVPEPVTLSLLGAGLVGAGLLKRKRRFSA